MLLRIYYIVFLLFGFVAGLSAQGGKNHAQLMKATEVAYNDGDYELAARYMSDARAKAIEKSGVKDSFYAIYTSKLAVNKSYLGEYFESEQLFMEALPLIIDIFGKEHIYYATIITDFGILYLSMGKYGESKRMLLEGTALYKKNPLWEDEYLTNLTNLADLYVTTGYYDQAEQLYLEVLAQKDKRTEEDYATTLSNLGVLYYSTKNYSKALLIYEQVAKLDADTYGKKHPYYAITLQNWAIIYSEINEKRKAIALYEVAIAIEAQTLGKKHPSYAHSLINLAVEYMDLDDLGKAQALYNEAQPIYLSAWGEESYEYALLCSKMSTLYYKMGDIATAHKYARATMAANSPDIDSTFSDWTKITEYEYYQNKITTEIIANVINIFRLEYQNTGDKSKLEQAYQLAQAAIQFNERVRNDFTAEADKLYILSDNNDFVFTAIDAAFELNTPEAVQKAFSFAEQNKAVLLLDAAKSEKAYQFGELPDSIVQKEKTLQQKYATLQAELLQNRPQAQKDSLRRIINDLNQEIKIFTQAIKSEYPKYAAIKYQQKNITVADIQAALPPKTAMLEYVIGDSCTYLFYISAQEFKLSRLPFTESELKRNIKILHNSLSNYTQLKDNADLAYKEYSETAHWFYKKMIEPAGINSANIEDLIVIPDGELGHLPFEAFLAEPAPEGSQNYAELHYVLRDFAISYSYSAALWLENAQTKKPVNNGQIFAMAADYTVKIDSAKAHLRLPNHQQLRKILRPLPAAQKEIAQIAAFIDGYFATDTLASEAVFKQKASQYSIVHLAMHGLLDNQNQLLSCLAFTENGDSSENNFLQVYEISQMQLNADLVVLSACETGYGRFQKGNGLASLARAFMYAGSPALIVSLWEVNDLTTSILMPSFYENLAQGSNKAQALRQTKLNYIRSAQGVAAHPAFWSAFVQMGDSRAIDINTKGASGNYKYLIFGAIIFILSLILGFFFLRRRKG
jgi:CHAT domain-containing protein